MVRAPLAPRRAPLCSFAALATALLAPIAAMAANTPDASSVAAAPIQFMPNRGQYASDARFVGFVPGATVRVEPGAVTYRMSRPSPGASRTNQRGPRLEPSSAEETLEIRATFPGANPAPEVRGEQVTGHLSHFYLGNDASKWRTHVPGYAAVRLRQLYPGIDLEYHGNGRALEYDFHVAPGADARRIRVHYEGVEKLAVTRDGQLEVTTRFGRGREAAPVAYQVIDGERRTIKARYRIVDRTTFAFAVDRPIDPSLPVVIDPVLHYSTYLGGLSYDEIHEIVANGSGNAWVVGGTLSPDFPASGTPVPSTDYVVFLSKVSSNGATLPYSVFLGGSANQIGYGLRIDVAGNAYIAGTTGSNDFPTTPGCYDPTFNGSNPGEGDLFISKFSPTGTLLYSTYLGGPDPDTGGRVALNSSGYVCVLASPGATGYPTTAGAYDTSLNGLSDIAVTVLNPAGLGAADLVYSTFLGGNNDDEAYDIEVDFGDRIYIAGSTRSSNFPATGGPTFNGTFDAMVAKIQPSGAGPADLVFATKFGGSGQDYGGGVKPDGTGMLYFSGSTASPDFQQIMGWQTTYGGGSYDGFLIRLLSNGTFVTWATFIGGSGEDRCGDVELDPAFNVTVLGYTNSSDFPTNGAPYDLSYNGGYDMFLATFDQGSLPLDIGFLGGTSNDWGYALHQDLVGRTYVAGNTQSTDYPVTAGVVDPSFNGGPIDAVVTKFTPLGGDTCQACVSPPDTCCAIPPPLDQVEHPYISPNAMVGTRQEVVGHPYVVTIYDLASPTPTPLEDTDWAAMTRYYGPTGGQWTQTALGTVFGLTLDRFGNIFVTHTSCYSGDQIATLPGGAAGGIYRIDGSTGAMNTFCVLPNLPDGSVAPGENMPGLGNISFDCRHDQFFVTNLEDGKIYRIKATGVNGPTGTVQETFDPLAPDNGLAGWAPAGERLWGVQVHGDRVYYAVWVEELMAPSATLANEIRSVGLLPSGAFDTSPGSDRHELWMLPSYGPPVYPGYASDPVSDISFSTSGRMLLAERDIYGLTFPNAHSARVMEYECVAGCWQPTNPFQVGSIGPYNSAGGIDYDRHPYTGGAIGRVWATGDALHLGQPYPDVIYGMQGFRPTGGSILNSMLVDSDGGVAVGDKMSMGDVEVPGCVNMSVGSVCGRKFNDLDRDGVRDSGEPYLAGWTIKLNGPGGPYTAVTDGSGAYCFDGLAPGNYVVTEVNQQGWIQTGPPGGSYNVTVTGGGVVTGRDFGNYACNSGTGSCAVPPPNMIAWWPFDELVSSPTAKDVTHLSPSRNVAQLVGAAAITASGHTGNMLCVPSELDYAIVPNSNQLGFQLGGASFAFDGWVKLDPAGGQRMLIEKRVLLSSGPYLTRGFALYYNGIQAFLEIGNGSFMQVVPGPNVPVSVWHHLAVVVDRSTNQGRWYLNGVHQASFNFVPISGPVSSNADIYIGRSSPAFGSASSLQGCLDDLEVFMHVNGNPLTAASIAAIHAAGVAGKCSDIVRAPTSTTICAGQTSVQVCFTICNTAPTTQSYHWSMQGLGAGPGCTVALNTTLSPASGTVTLAPGACSVPICVTVPRPLALTTHNATTCYELMVVNDATGRCQSSIGKIRADQCWCPTVVAPPLVNVPGRMPPGDIGVPVVVPWHNPCGGTAIPYRISAAYEPTGGEDPLAVSLNGLPPGEPVIGTLSVGPSFEGESVALVSLPRGYDPMALYEIKLEADMDGDGQYEPIDSRHIQPTYDEEGTTGVEPAATIEDAVRLTLQPNPFFRGSSVSFTLARAEDASLAIYDISGRLLRSLHRGRLAAGPHSFQWNGRDASGREAPAGVYFVRLDSARIRLDSKLVKLR